jgi:hypothetical protein
MPFVVSAQVDIKNNKLTDPNIKILYIGIDNVIEVTGLTNFDKLELHSSTGQVTQNEWNKTPNTFLVTTGYSNFDTLRLYQNKVLILSRIYEIKSINKPIPQLGNILDSVATIKQILKNPKLNIIIPECLFNPHFYATKFNLTLLNANGDTLIPFDRTEGSHLTKTQIRAIQKLRMGDKISFTRISITCPNCSNLILKPYTIYIE